MGTVVERTADHRRGGVVQDEGDAEVLSDRRHLGDREHLQHRVRQRLAVVDARARVGRPAEALRIVGIDEADLDDHGLQRVGEEVPGAAVEAAGSDRKSAYYGKSESLWIRFVGIRIFKKQKLSKKNPTTPERV